MKAYLTHFILSMIFWHLPQPKWVSKLKFVKPKFKEEGEIQLGMGHFVAALGLCALAAAVFHVDLDTVVDFVSKTLIGGQK